MKRLYGHRALFFMTSRPPFSSFFSILESTQAPCSATFFHTAVSARFLRAPPKLTLTADVANFYARFFRTSYFITLFRQALKGGEGPGVVILHHCFSPRSLYLSAHAGRGTTERRPACDRVSSCVRLCLVPRSLTSILKEMDNRFLGIFFLLIPVENHVEKQCITRLITPCGQATPPRKVIPPVSTAFHRGFQTPPLVFHIPPSWCR